LLYFHCNFEKLLPISFNLFWPEIYFDQRILTPTVLFPCGCYIGDLVWLVYWWFKVCGIFCHLVMLNAWEISGFICVTCWIYLFICWWNLWKDRFRQLEFSARKISIIILAVLEAYIFLYRVLNESKWHIQLVMATFGSIQTT
jgi:hypothetical protein